MKPLHVIAALVVAVAALFAFPPGFATDYANNPNPTCRGKRNVIGQARLPAAPNEASMQAVVAANRIGNFPRALVTLVLIDKLDTEALRTLTPNLPHIDDVIDRHLFNLTYARSVLGKYLSEGKPGVPQRPDDAAAVFQRAVDTSFTDDRGCEHRVYASFEARADLAAMYLYGIGTAPDRAKARSLMAGDNSANAKAIVTAIDRDRLPPNYAAFLRVANNEMDSQGPTLEEKQKEEFGKAVTKMFGLPNPNEEPSPPSIGYLIAPVIAALVAIVMFVTFLELRRARNDPNDAGGLFDALRAAFGRLDLFFKGIMSLGIGCSALYWILSSPALMPSFQWFNYVLIAAMLIAVGHGIFSVAAALRANRRADNTLVHGGARPSPEAEAHAAARGGVKSDPLHGRVFSD